MRKRQKEEGSQSDRTWLDLTFAEPEFRSLVGGLWGIMLYTLGVPLWWALIYIYSFSSSLIKKFYPLPILKHWYGDWWSWQILPPNSNRNTQIYCLFSVYFHSLCIFFCFLKYFLYADTLLGLEDRKTGVMFGGFPCGGCYSGLHLIYTWCCCIQITNAPSWHIFLLFSRTKFLDYL